MKHGIIVGAAAALITAGGAMGGTTPVYSTIADLGEPNHLQILQGIYSGATVTASGLDFNVDFGSGNSFLVQRIADSFDATMGDTLQIGAADLSTMSDQIWQDGIVNTAGRARYAGFSQAFGTGDTTADGTINANWAFDVNGSGLNVTGGAQLSLGVSPFSWVRGDQAVGDAFGGNLQSSLEGDNPSNVDEMVSYYIEDDDYNGGLASFLLFFEDSGAGPDRDFNDLVIEINVVPVPAAALLGLAGLGAVGAVRRRMISGG